MRYVSIFSGVEAASLAWAPLGWEPVCFSEIDPFPSAVLAHRYPDVPNLGDITKIDWKKAVKSYGKPDVVVGGSPCQSFSIAGGRTGLDGASGLMWEYVRCVRELMPRWILWENVPGALSSSNGEDFGCLLRELDALGYGLAWRVLDAQFFGLAQRRERVFVVGRLGDVEGPCEVLFEPESLSWDSQSSREKRASLAGSAEGGPRASGFKWHQGSGAGSIGLEDEQSPTLTADYHNPAVMCMTDTQPHSMVDGEVCGALSATMHKDPPVLCMQNTTSNAAVDHDMCGTLTAGGGVPMIARNDGFVSDEDAPRMRGGGKGPLIQTDVSGSLATGNDQTLFEPVSFAANQRGEVRLQGGDGDVVGAIPATQSGNQVQGVAQGYAVRRLTPRECERLQGFPSVVELEVEKMTPNELIACALANGDIFCDFDTGEVYGTRGPGGIKLKEPRKLGFKHPSGYIHVSLHAGREKKQVRAHRIVYMAAYGEIPDGMVIDHVNNDKSDNRLSNLQMMTPEENSRKAAMEDRYLSGEENPRCKIGAEVRTKMMHDYSEHGMTYRDLARKYGVSKSRVGQIAHEDDWTKVPYRGKPSDECPDTPRYKAIGNSMAVNVMKWIGMRIQEAES